MADRTSYLADIVDVLAQRWPDNRTVNIVCHGHSVPAGYFAGTIIMPFEFPHWKDNWPRVTRHYKQWWAHQAV